MFLCFFRRNLSQRREDAKMSENQVGRETAGVLAREKCAGVALFQRRNSDKSFDREAPLKPAVAEKCDAMTPHGLKPVSDGGAG